MYGRLYEIEASFEKPGPPALKKWLSALYIVNAKERSYYKHFRYCQFIEQQIPESRQRDDSLAKTHIQEQCRDSV